MKALYMFHIDTREFQGYYLEEHKITIRCTEYGYSILQASDLGSYQEDVFMSLGMEMTLSDSFLAELLNIYKEEFGETENYLKLHSLIVS